MFIVYPRPSLDLLGEELLSVNCTTILTKVRFFNNLLYYVNSCKS